MTKVTSFFRRLFMWFCLYRLVVFFLPGKAKVEADDEEEEEEEDSVYSLSNSKDTDTGTSSEFEMANTILRSKTKGLAFFFIH